MYKIKVDELKKDSKNFQSVRAVAYLDVLGFKKMIQTKNLSKLGSMYTKLISDIENLGEYYLSSKNKGKGLCKRFIFSDSIILVANDDSEKSFIDLVIYTWRFLQLSMAMKMPLRGAISYGQVYIDEKHNIFLGDAIVNSVLLEQKQDWIGVIIDNKAEERYHNIFLSKNDMSIIYNELMYKYNIPLKNNEYGEFRAINWRLNMVVKKGTKSLFEINEEESVNKKVNNTLEFAKKIVEGGRLYISGKDIPIEYGITYIGNTKPPFKHGDDL